MPGGLKKKVEPKPTDTMRNLLGTYDQSIVSTPLDQSLQQIVLGQPINLSTTLGAPKQKVNITKDKLGQINLGTANTVADILPPKTNDKVKKYLESKGKLKSEPETPVASEPFFSDNTKKTLRDAGILLSGGLASLGEGIKGGNQVAANAAIGQNLQAAQMGDEQKLLDDPNSDYSKQARSLFTQLYGTKVKPPENMTAAQFSAQSPVFDKILQRKIMEMRASAPKQATTPKIAESSEKNLRLAKQLQNDYAELGALQAKVGNETFGTPEKQKMDLLKNRIIESESVLSGQGALEQGIREQKTGLLDVGTFEGRQEAANRNKKQGQNYYFNEAKNLADQTGMDLDQDEKTGKLYLVDPATGQRVRAL